jgi:hypothetical protein
VSDDRCSKTTRVQPIFGWLREHGRSTWADELLTLADGVQPRPVGEPLKVDLDPERKVAPSAARLAWMIRNAGRLAPKDGRKWGRYQQVADHPRRDAVLQQLDGGVCAVAPAILTLEGETCADCLITCEHAVIWIEGKRNDWLAPSTEWDVSRDQLARNIESVWLLAAEAHLDYYMVICHEAALKHHEAALVDGYRSGTWSAGLPHVTEATRHEFQSRIGTLTWSKIIEHWPALRDVVPTGAPP